MKEFAKIDLTNDEGFNINLEILRRLSEGMMFQDISNDLKKKGIKPNSVSIIDKRLKYMRKELNCNTIHQMMYKVGKMNLV